MIKARVATLLDASPGFFRSILSYTAVTTLIFAIAWAVVNLPASRSILLIGVGLGVVIWLLYPDVAVYAMVLLIPFTVTYNVGPLANLRAEDALLIAMAGTVFATGLLLPRRTSRFDSNVPRAILGLWIFLLVWGSIAYLTGPTNQWLIKDPVRNTWYLYRAVWRDLLTFILVVYYIRENQSISRLIESLLIISTGVAAYSIWMASISGHRAHDPFYWPNQLAAFLILVIPYGLARLAFEARLGRRILLVAALLVMIRALWLTGSRGGFVAFLASLWPFAMILPRKRLAVAGVAALVAVSLVLVAKGDLLNRPYVQRFLTLTSPTEVSTLQWRQEQWAHFVGRIMERPLLGTGSSVDLTIDKQVRLQTSHNAYLAFAMRSGIPVTAAWICIFGLTGFVAIRRAWFAVERSDRIFWIGTASFLTALSVHAMNETALLTQEIQQFFWIITAFIVVRLSLQQPRGNLDGRILSPQAGTTISGGSLPVGRIELAP